jgi:hypothetical protein
MAASSPMAVRTMTPVINQLLLQVTQSKGKLTGVLALLGEELVDLVTNLAIGDLDVVLGGAVVRHEGKETILRNVDLGWIVSLGVLARGHAVSLTRRYSWRRTLGTFMLWVEGQSSSSFLEVKMSMATK